jgi:hypothetical protein
VKFTPPTVKVRLPLLVLNQAIKDLFANVELTPNHPDLDAARKDGKTTVTIKDLPVTLAIQNKHVKLMDVKSVTAEVTFKAQSDRILTFLPVYPSAAADVTDKYSIIAPVGVPGGVTVVGPEDQLDKLMDPSAKAPPAFFLVTEDDARDALQRGEAGKTAQVYIPLPEGVKVKGGLAPTITYKVKKRGG